MGLPGRAATREWEPLTTALAPYGDLAADTRFATEAQRAANDAALAETLGAILQTRPARDWEAELTARDVACVVVAETAPEVATMDGDDCVGRTMGILVDLEHPMIGEYPRLTPLAAMSRSAGVTGPAPLLGAHTNAVLAELGFADERIEDLRREASSADDTPLR